MSNIKILAFSLAEQIDQLNRAEKATNPLEKLRILTGQDLQEELFNVGGRLYTAGQLDHSYEAPEMVEEEYD